MWEKCSKTGLCAKLHLCKLLKFVQVYIHNGQILWHANFTSMKLFKKKSHNGFIAWSYNYKLSVILIKLLSPILVAFSKIKSQLNILSLFTVMLMPMLYKGSHQVAFFSTTILKNEEVLYAHTFTVCCTVRNSLKYESHKTQFSALQDEMGLFCWFLSCNRKSGRGWLAGSEAQHETRPSTCLSSYSPRDL